MSKKRRAPPPPLNGTLQYGIANDRPLSKEEVALEKFKDRVHDLLTSKTDDHYLRKWLKARQFDVEKAEQMFRNSMAFREKMKIDTLLATYTPPEVLRKYLTGGFPGFDKDGSPIRVELYGRIDLKGLMASVKKSDLEKTKLLQGEYTVQLWEEQSKKLGKRVDGITVIIDMDGVGTRMMWRPGLKMHTHLASMLEDNYPEMMKRLIVVNAPRIFPLLYKLARPLISADMQNKIHVHSTNFESTLLQYIDADQLPAFLGGTLRDPDGNPRCATWIGQGGDVPEEYFMQNNDKLLEHMKVETVRAGDKLYLDFDVTQAGSMLRWEFKTDDYDIGFGVFLKKPGDKNKTSVIAVERVSSHVVAEDGCYECMELGTYYLCFDNSYSWTRSKRIYYMGEVLYTDNNIMDEVNRLVDNGDWETLALRFETTHL